MRKNKLIVRLKGGLGNQMFQYAAGLGIAARAGLDLVIDTFTGFVVDRQYRRRYSLHPFRLDARDARLHEQAPFLLEQYVGRLAHGRAAIYPEGPRESGGLKRRPWGLHMVEAHIRFHPELEARRYERDVWLDGYWHSERYFADSEQRVADTFRIDSPKDDRFLTLERGLDRSNAVAIGIRLYEEAAVVHPTPKFSFYESAARELAKDMEKPEFYLFCTVRAPIDEKLDLPGPIHYVTHDDGYNGELNRLWLLTQFRHHIASYSSFYWWGAWLAERRFGSAKVIASGIFNADTIPPRWTRCADDSV